MSVIARIEPRVIPTYPVGEPEKNPVFFEKRVYQGSNGKVYPVPFIDKVYDEPVDVTYQSVLLENDFVRLVLLPEIGGRILIGQDKTNDDYDFFYRQDVIKPALVGLAGPWISGGVEFNWPQHHRPGTFMPADVHIEEEPDGARTVWMSEHDPLDRLKGMHGIRLRPDSSLIELRARLYNRTPLVHTFLWWANVAAMVHDQYQSFFPTDVSYVADHAVRATSSFPIADNPYYGIDYQNRPGANDLGWYKNIPVPTSYMVCQTAFDFFGGYDYSKQGGFVHVANRHISPGKKQWTWGNHDFGWAWDRELTDEGGPYIELMAGVYTDNQPDFSYLHPYETKTFSQCWWPIQGIGTVQQANEQAALAMKLREESTIELGLCVSSAFEGKLTISNAGETFATAEIALKPGEAWKHGEKSPTTDLTALRCELWNRQGELVLSYQPVDPSEQKREREQATEPSAPEDIASVDELFLTGEHLEQYRHPTRDPEAYWLEALQRDAGDARCNTALGKRALGRGEFAKAHAYFETAVRRLTIRHPNPVTGDAHYYLGLSKRWLGDQDGAYRALYKSTWDYAWGAAAYYHLATIDCCRGDYATAREHLEASLKNNQQNNTAKVLLALVHGKLGQPNEAERILGELLEVDPLDHWASHVLHRTIPEASRNDAQTVLDLVFDYCEAGFFAEALSLLKDHHKQETAPVAVPNPLERTAMTGYAIAWIKAMSGAPDAQDCAVRLDELSGNHFFPSRLQEMVILQEALAANPQDPVAAYGLGNFYFDKRRHSDAIEVWEQAVAAGTTIPQVYRNLGIAVWNYDRDGESATTCYQRAMELDPGDARLVCESDQLAQKRNVEIGERLEFLTQHEELVLQRDDATVALASLYNLTGRPEKALELITSRRFHPWEGGEGSVLRQYTAARILLGKKALETKDYSAALEQFSQAFATPDSLGEAYHPLQAKADVNYWKGKSLRALGCEDEAEEHFRESANESGDFADMAVTEHSPLSYYRGLSLRELGKEREAEELFTGMFEFARTGLQKKAAIDYFATSLPNLLVFDEDLQGRSDAAMHLVAALAKFGLGESGEAMDHLQQHLAFERDNQQARDLLNEIQAATKR